MRNLVKMAEELSCPFKSFHRHDDGTFLSRKSDAVPSLANTKKLTYFLDNLPGSIRRGDFDNSPYLFIHHHHRFPGLKEVIPHIKKCSTRLEKQGDKLYLLVSVREPVKWLRSKVNYNNQLKEDCRHYCHSSADTDMNFIMNTKQMNFEKYKDVLFNGQSKYLLYNSASWSLINAPDKAEVRQIIDFVDGLYCTDNLKHLEDDLRAWIDEDFKWDSSKHNVSKPREIISPTELQREYYLGKSSVDLWMYQMAKGSVK